MNGDRGAADSEQLLGYLDGGEILTCTFATMDMLQRAVAAELGEDDGADYGLGARGELELVHSDGSADDESG